MGTTIQKAICAAITITFVLGMYVTAGASEKDAANPLVEEMVVLDQVFREVVSGVAMGDGERVSKALKEAHGTMEKTHEGLHKGTVKIPKNSQRVKEFVKMDRQFHHNLEALAEAAEKDNLKKMTALTNKLLQGCVSCHKVFRK